MLWTTCQTRAVWVWTFLLWRGIPSLLFCVFFSEGWLWAQTTIYTWTDERGIIHYSDSMVPSQQSEQVERKIMPSHSSSQSRKAGAVESIPLVILNDDPSQKFVHTVLEGDHVTREVLMLVDTGAQITLIDADLAEELALEHVQDALLGGVTGTAQGWIGRLPTLRLGTEEIRDLHVMVGPLPGRLLLGMDVLEQLELSVGRRSLHRSR